MNNQNGPFTNSNWRRPDQYSIDSTNQRTLDEQEWEPTYLSSTPPPPPPPSFYPYARQEERKRRKFRLWPFFLVLMLIVLGGTGVSLILLSGSPAKPQAARTSETTSAGLASNNQTTLTVTTYPMVIIVSQEADNGLIYVHAGKANNKVILRLTNPNNAAPAATIPYEQTKDRSTIILSMSGSGGENLDVTVPTTTNLKLTTNGDNMEVSGVRGQMVLAANSGSITVTGSTVRGPSLLSNNSGPIKATQDTLSGQVTSSNNSGTITFIGSIDPAGAYRFEGNGGLLAITFPRNASFHVDATINNSAITSDFPGAPVQNGEIHADVGKLPRALVTVYNNNGQIALHA